MDDLYLEMFRREERRRDRVEAARQAREDEVRKHCTFHPKVSRDDASPLSGDAASERLYDDAQKKSINMLKLIQRLEKKELMHKPTFKPKIMRFNEDEEEFDREKLTERLFQSAKDIEAKRERTREKFYKNVCPFFPNAQRKKKKDNDEDAVKMNEVITRLYEEEVARRKEKRELSQKKLRKAEGLTFQPNMAGKRGPQKILTQEEHAKMVENLWQEAKDRQSKLEFIRSKEEKRLAKTIGKRQDKPKPKGVEDEKVDGVALGQKLFDEFKEREIAAQKREQQIWKIQLRQCNNFSPIVDKDQISKIIEIERRTFSPKKKFT